MKTVIRPLLLAILLAGVAVQAHARDWQADAAHTHVGFSVSHLFTSVQGRFSEFEATIAFDPDDPRKAVVKATVQVASINTDNAKRDKHLRSRDFFDVEKYPVLKFESTEMKEWSGKKGKLAGSLSIHGVTKPVVFDVLYHGEGADPWGNVRAGFRATLTIDRKDYGLNWNEVLETGGFLVGDEVEIRIDAEGILTE